MSIPPPGAVVTSLRSLLDGASQRPWRVQLWSDTTGGGDFEPRASIVNDSDGRLADVEERFGANHECVQEPNAALIVTLVNAGDEIEAVVSARLAWRVANDLADEACADEASTPENTDRLCDEAYKAREATLAAVDAILAKFPPRASVAT